MYKEDHFLHSPRCLKKKKKKLFKERSIYKDLCYDVCFLMFGAKLMPSKQLSGYSETNSGFPKTV